LTKARFGLPGFVALGLAIFDFSLKAGLMFAILIPYCMGGIGRARLQGYMSKQRACK